MADVATMGSTLSVSCVKISSLEDASVDATALDNALAGNAAQLEVSSSQWVTTPI